MKAFFIGELQTQNFQFLAIAETKIELFAAIAKAWQKHCKQTGADIDLCTADDIRVSTIAPNECIRDFQKI